MRYQVAEKLLFVPYIVQSFVDLILVSLIEPEGYAPYKNIDQEINDSHHYEYLITQNKELGEKIKDMGFDLVNHLAVTDN